MTSSDRTPARLEPPARPPGRGATLTTLASLATALIFAFTGHDEAVIAALAAAGAVQVTIHFHR
ncbi:hypothetical protein [Streptomyces flaveolus]|uniref:hypothetical protein n=1 Tax=Streptomyces flaveolus TaxID=67297 RepID=UPI0033F4CD8D